VNNRAREASNFDGLDDSSASEQSHRSSGVQARAKRISVAPVAGADEEEPLISIGAPADPSLLEPTYAYLSAYCFANFSPPVAQRLNVAIYELYANALRYGVEGAQVRIELRRAGNGARLRVRNLTTVPNRERLEQQVERVHADPSAAFTSEMNRFAGACEPPPMLGIVRVAHEAALPLTLRVGQDWVEISTVCQ
jgi:hypothetical protein